MRLHALALAPLVGCGFWPSAEPRPVEDTGAATAPEHDALPIPPEAPEVGEVVGLDACGALRVLAEAGDLDLAIEMYVDLYGIVSGDAPRATTVAAADAFVAAMVDGLDDGGGCSDDEPALPLDGPWWRGTAGQLTAGYVPLVPEEAFWESGNDVVGRVILTIDGLVLSPQNGAVGEIELEYTVLTVDHHTPELPH